MAAIPLQHAESSNIAGASYDVDTQELAVKFKSGATYIYENLGQDTADAFEQADSAGKYFDVNIKNRFPYKKA
jgi:hypothetical protein